MSVKFDDFLKEQLQDPDIKKEYDDLQPERAIIQALIDARLQTGMTQKENGFAGSYIPGNLIC